jgi:lipopolysaccharide biosynthesis glycosyltransferase
VNKPAIFVAGDERIFFPALVALDSIATHNPGVFDAFMCFDGGKLTKEMSEALNHHKINFIDAADLGVSERIGALPKMKEGRWPIEILLNWALPEYLHSQGYQQSIKVDYDILCIKKYELSEVLPESGIARGLLFNINLEKEGIPPDIERIAIQLQIFKPGVKAYMNAGFVSFDNEKCHKHHFFAKLLAAYAFISSHCPKANLIEQLAVFFTLSLFDELVEDLAPAYNHRVRWGILVDKDLQPTAKNIHYITNIKPWMPFDRTVIRHFVNDRQGVIFAYRSIWLERAATSPWFDRFCSEPRTSQAKALGISILIAHNYNQRILGLEKQLSEAAERTATLESKLLEINSLSKN